MKTTQFLLQINLLKTVGPTLIKYLGEEKNDCSPRHHRGESHAVCLDFGDQGPERVSSMGTLNLLREPDSN